MKIVKIKNSGKHDSIHVWFDRESEKSILKSKTAINGASLDSLNIGYEQGSSFVINTAKTSLDCTVTAVSTTELNGGHTNTVYICKATPKT